MTRDLITRCLLRWANLPFVVRCLLLVTVVGGPALLALKPGYRWFREWRMERNLIHASKALDEIRMQEALDLSLTVLRAGDIRIEAFRILEKSAASLRDPRHAEIARALIFHSEGNDEDRLTGFLGVVDRAPLGLVGQSWVALPDSCRTDPRFATAFARRLLVARRVTEAASVLLAVPEAKHDDELKRGLVEVLIDSGRPEGRHEAQKLIAAGISGDGADVVRWLDLLESIPVLSLEWESLEPLLGHLDSMDEVSAGRRALMLSRLDYATNFGQRAAILKKAASDWRDRDPLEFARFLRGLGLHRALLESFQDASGVPGLSVLLLDSVCLISDWNRLSEWLDTTGHDLPRLQELGLRAVIKLKSGSFSEGADAWAAAMNEASGTGDDDAYLKLQDIAVKAALPEHANQALLAAIRSGCGPLPLYGDLKPLLISLQAQGQEKALLEVTATYLHFEPGNPVLLTQYAYLACLNHLIKPTDLLQALEPIAHAMPGEMPIQCVLATAYLCDSQPQEAEKLLGRLRVEVDRLAPSFRIVFLASGVQNGSLSADDPAVNGFPWSKLLPSERRVFGALMKGPAPKTNANDREDELTKPGSATIHSVE
jgi:hypothetical protein